MAQKCQAVVNNPKRGKDNQPCGNWAKHGSIYCNKHNGPDGGSEPERLANRCIRRKKNGEQCRSSAVRGSTVCMKHGQNKFSLAKAQQRLASFVDPALSTMYDLMMNPDTDDNLRAKLAMHIAAIAGLNPGQRLEIGVELKPWEVTLKGVLKEVPVGEQYEALRIPGVTQPTLEDIEDAVVIEEDIDPRGAARAALPHLPRPEDRKPRPQPVQIGSAEPPHLSGYRR